MLCSALLHSNWKEKVRWLLCMSFVWCLLTFMAFADLDFLEKTVVVHLR